MDQERVESIKAGGLAALTGTGVSAMLIALHPHLLSASALTTGILRVAVATVCAFLFGVTYRYIVRNDSNPHLRSGAVGAFALTRSLGQLESITPPDLALSGALPLAVPIVESFGLFICIRLVLDWGLKQQWFQPFESD
ncbi:hypothetical protein Lepto7375DRAFT_3879 [Leptolyngbya sp. PCC 7375]|nr:hypothetical protein Lepto7375DRAFT_3879 [Leptolyngbya sp. PCC 7375]